MCWRVREDTCARGRVTVTFATRYNYNKKDVFFFVGRVRVEGKIGSFPFVIHLDSPNPLLLLLETKYLIATVLFAWEFAR